MKRFAALLLLAMAAGALAQAPRSQCPASRAKVDLLLTSTLPVRRPQALALVRCGDPVVRELGLQALGDAEPDAAILDAIADALDDPAQTVRRAALIAALRQRAAMLPVIAARVADSGRPRRFEDMPSLADALAKGDIALSALTALGGDVDAARIGNHLATVRPPPAAGRFAPAVAGGAAAVSIRSTRTADRELAIRQRCGKDPAAIILTVAGGPDCPGLSGGDSAVLSQFLLTGPFATQIDAFETMLQSLAASRIRERTRARQELAARQAEEQAEQSSNLRVNKAATSAYRSSAASRPARQPSARIGAVRSAAKPLARLVVTSSAAAPPPALLRPSASLPLFPWPAPKPVKQYIIPVRQIGGRGATLDQVLDRLQKGIAKASSGYETGVFAGPPGGFVLLTRLERVQQSGVPFDEARRFTEKGNPKAGFLDMLKSLLGERPGYFRVIAFVVANRVAVDPRTPVEAIPLDQIGDVSQLPRALGRLHLDDRSVYVLVYAFERPPGRPRRPWIAGAPTAREHLVRSGIAAALGL